MGKLPLQILVAFLVLNQVFVHGLAGAVLVRCQNVDGQETTQIAHHQTCQCSGHGPTLATSNDATTQSPAIHHGRHCVDAPLDSTVMARQGNDATPVKVCTTALLWIADVPLATKANTSAPLLDISPGSAELLARHTILLI